MATRTQRIQDEPAFVLHRYDWSESSLILEVFCRRQGRVALVAKGAKKPSSNFRPVLLPLQPLKLNYTLGAEGNADLSHWATESFRLLVDSTAACLPTGSDQDKIMSTAIALWSLVHGYATLHRDGQLNGLPPQAMPGAG